MSDNVINYTENELFSMIGRGYEYACEVHDGFVTGELFGGKLSNLPNDADGREDVACSSAVLALFVAEINSPNVNVTVECMENAVRMMKVVMSARRLASYGYLKQNGIDQFGLPTYTVVKERFK